VSDPQQRLLKRWAKTQPPDPRWIVSAIITLFGVMLLLGLDYIYELLRDHGVVDS